MKCIQCGSEMTPTIGGNYYCSKCNVCLNDAVYRITKVNNDAEELNATIIYKYEKEITMLRKCLEEKDQLIKELEEQIEKFKMGEIIPISVAKKSFEMRDKQIKELEEKVKYYKNCYEGCVNNHKYIMEGQRELSFNLYIALAKTLEKQGLIDDVPSVIDQLVGKNCGKYADMYNEYKCYKNKCIELRNYIMNYYDDGVNRPQQSNEYIKATCKDILEKMKDLKTI